MCFCVLVCFCIYLRAKKVANSIRFVGAGWLYREMTDNSGTIVASVATVASSSSSCSSSIRTSSSATTTRSALSTYKKLGCTSSTNANSNSCSWELTTKQGLVLNSRCLTDHGSHDLGYFSIYLIFPSAFGHVNTTCTNTNE